MPPRKRTRKGAYRPYRTGHLRKQQTRYKKRNALVRVPRDKLGFPQSMASTLRLVQKIPLDLGPTGAIVLSEFIANDLFNTTDGSLPYPQPRSFDEYMTLYETFTVSSSRCSVNFMFEAYHGATGENTTDKYLVNPGASATESAALPAVICGLHKSVTSGYTTGAKAEDLMEQDRTQWKVLTSTGNPQVLSSSIKTSDFFGKDALVGSEGYTGTKSQGPANRLYWQVWAGTANGNSLPVGAHVRVVAYVTIEFNARFTDPRTLVDSHG